MWHWGYESWWMGAVMLLNPVSVVALVVWAIRVPGRDHTPAQPDARRSALDILEERHARGGIHDDEFRRRRGAPLDGHR